MFLPAVLAAVGAAGASSNDAGPTVFDIGLPRTGTRYMTSIFEHLGYRAAHEPFGGELNNVMISYLDEEKSHTEVMDWLKKQKLKSLKTDMWSSFQLGPILPLVMKVFPQSVYVYQMRHPLQWAESVYNLLPTSANKFPEVMKRLIHEVDLGRFPREETTLDVRHKMSAIRNFGFPVNLLFL